MATRKAAPAPGLKAAPTPRVWIAGATGLIGRELVQAALGSAHEVHALTRRATDGAAHKPRLHWHLIDFATLAALPGPAAPADLALCALGTTIKVAGSQAAFAAVDRDAVLAFARAARAAGIRRFGVVSALGADTRSPTFYNRVKGQMEDGLRALGFESLVIARPSLLAGDRGALGQAGRIGERLALAVAMPLSKLIPSGWRPIEARRVAHALLGALRDAPPGEQVLDSARMQEDES